jgi:hypothetical protein
MVAMNKTSLVFLLLILLILAAGCGPDQTLTGGAGLQAWIDAPLDESVLPLDPYEIVAHASDPQAIINLEIQVNGTQLASLPNSDPGELLALFKQVWMPPAPGEYRILVRAQNSAGEWSEDAVVVVSVQAQPESAVVMQPQASESPEPIDCTPSLTAEENTTCRTGPSSYHDPVAYLLEGESAQISGRNQDLTWWSVQLPDQDVPCWIADSTVSADCISEDLPYLESPPFITRIGKSSPEFYWGDNPNKTITIQAMAGGESPLEQLRVVYHIQGRDNWTSTVMTNTSGDLWEGVMYARNLKGFENFHAAKVEYYLEAVSQNGLSTQSQMLADITLKKTP